MRYRLSVLRHQGVRLSAKSVLCPEVRIESKSAEGFLSIHATKYMDGQLVRVALLYEPKVLKWAPECIHLMGFERDGKAAHVQEWLLEDFKLGFGRQVSPVSPQNRFNSSE